MMTTVCRENPKIRQQYRYALSDCRVRRHKREDLKQFRERLVFWHEILFTDEHAIWKQISIMLWNDFVFRMVNESRRLGSQSGGDSAALNPTLARFIDESYISNQLLAIRRLTDRSARGDQVSLPRLIDSIKESLRLFTRELWVCHDGLPYDFRHAKREFYKNLPGPSCRDGHAWFTGVQTGGPKGFLESERRHKHFDRIANTKCNRRTRDDYVDESRLQELKNELGACASFNKFADKYIAHAADQISRGELPPGASQITLDRIERCQKSICHVAGFISGHLLYFGGSAEVPAPQFDICENLDEPWIRTSDLPELRNFWWKRMQEVDEWSK